MDCKIQNGDIVLDSCGKYIRLSGDEELLQRAYIKVAFKAGEFFYNRKLGIKNLVKSEDKQFIDKFNLILKEALIDCPEVVADVIEFDDKSVKVRFKCGIYEREDIINF